GRVLPVLIEREGPVPYISGHIDKKFSRQPKGTRCRGTIIPVVRAVAAAHGARRRVGDRTAAGDRAVQAEAGAERPILRTSSIAAGNNSAMRPAFRADAGSSSASSPRLSSSGPARRSI